MIETVYTYEEWQKEHRRRQMKAQKERQLYKRKIWAQRLFGFLFIVLAVMIPIVCDGDASASVFIAMIGCFLIFTKETVLFESSKNN